MFKYVLKMLAGQNPMQVLSDMPERDFNKVAGFVSNLDKSGIPRKQRRMIERKWNDTYGKERHSHKKYDWRLDIFFRGDLLPCGRDYG